jgi:hypothetical protein
MGWIELNNFSREELSEARKQIHQAAQLPAIAGRGLNPKDSSDNYAALIYDKNNNRLTSQSLGDSEFRVALCISDFKLVIINGKEESSTSFTLDSIAYDEAFSWLADKLSQLGFDSNKLNKDLPYKIPEYPTSKGTPFKQTNIADFIELQNYFFNAAFVLENISKNEKNISRVYCWPHHFDTAALITIERNSSPEKSKTIGVGLSPGDESYNEPYFYVSPWPNPENKENLPKLNHGHWHRQGWFGAVLAATEIIKNNDKSEQLKIAVSFIEAGIDNLKKLI